VGCGPCGHCFQEQIRDCEHDEQHRQQVEAGDVEALADNDAEEKDSKRQGIHA
jgi:hypothetical protein